MRRVFRTRTFTRWMRKADSIEIQDRDYYQGESCTCAVGCKFSVATSARHTSMFKLVPGLPGEFVAINEIPRVTDWGDASCPSPGNRSAPLTPVSSTGQALTLSHQGRGNSSYIVDVSSPLVMSIKHI